MCLFYAYNQSSLTLLEKSQVTGLVGFCKFMTTDLNVQLTFPGSPRTHPLLNSHCCSFHLPFQSTHFPYGQFTLRYGCLLLHLRKQKTSKTPLPKHTNPSAPVYTTSLPSLLLQSIVSPL